MRPRGGIARRRRGTRGVSAPTPGVVRANRTHRAVRDRGCPARGRVADTGRCVADRRRSLDRRSDRGTVAARRCPALCRRGSRRPRDRSLAGRPHDPGAGISAPAIDLSQPGHAGRAPAARATRHRPRRQHQERGARRRRPAWRRPERVRSGDPRLDASAHCCAYGVRRPISGSDGGRPDRRSQRAERGRRAAAAGGRHLSRHRDLGRQHRDSCRAGIVDLAHPAGAGESRRDRDGGGPAVLRARCRRGGVGRARGHGRGHPARGARPRPQGRVAECARVRRDACGCRVTDRDPRRRFHPVVRGNPRHPAWCPAAGRSSATAWFGYGDGGCPLPGASRRNAVCRHHLRRARPGARGRDAVRPGAVRRPGAQLCGDSAHDGRPDWRPRAGAGVALGERGCRCGRMGRPPCRDWPDPLFIAGGFRPVAVRECASSGLVADGALLRGRSRPPQHAHTADVGLDARGRRRSPAWPGRGRRPATRCHQAAAR